MSDFQQKKQEILKAVNDYVYLRAINSPIKRGMDLAEASKALDQLYMKELEKLTQVVVGTHSDLAVPLEAIKELLG